MEPSALGDVYVVDVLKLPTITITRVRLPKLRKSEVMRLYTRSLGVSVPSQPP